MIDLTDEKAKSARNLTEFRKSYELLEKNRSVLCNADGKLKPGNMKYYKKYRLLVEKTATWGKIVTEDMLHEVYIPGKDAEHRSEIEDMAKNMSAMFSTAITKGTFAEFMALAKDFIGRARTLCEA